jgi:anti-sigma factor RsiW
MKSLKFEPGSEKGGFTSMNWFGLKCRRCRQRIHWLAAEVLEAAEIPKLMAHLHTCPRCREYQAKTLKTASQLHQYRLSLNQLEPGAVARRRWQKAFQTESAPQLARSFARWIPALAGARQRWGLAALASAWLLAAVLHWTGPECPTAGPAPALSGRSLLATLVARDCPLFRKEGRSSTPAEVVSRFRLSPSRRTNHQTTP